MHPREPAGLSPWRALQHLFDDALAARRPSGKPASLPRRPGQGRDVAPPARGCRGTAASPRRARCSGRILAETLIANGDWFEAILHAEGALPYMVDSCVDCQQIAYLRGDIAYARFRLYDLAGAREWLTTDTLTTLRVWSRWPHNVRLRAEDIARTVGIGQDAAAND